MERKLGGQIQGQAEMKSPDILFGVLSTPERWYLGKCYRAASPWLSHKNKPQNYSTGLSTVVARALVNIAAPRIAGKKVIDPCCGMGNVVIEGLSMGMDIVGRDINPLAIRGARVNLNHFGYGDSLLVELGDLRDITMMYDAAIVDMPYNLCSVMSKEQCQEMLQAVYKFSERAVIVSSEQLEDDIVQAGWCIKGQCTVAKGSFVRYVWLCCKSLDFDL
ncbi:Mg-protoporphyrin IX methyl transferase [compost metagenome]